MPSLLKERRQFLYYKRRQLAHSVKRRIFGEKDHKYVFILSGARAGSTLLTNIIATGPDVSLTNDRGTCEGQTLPDMRGIYNRWDWALTKTVYRKHWDLTKRVLVEKSPPNLFKAEEIQEHFVPAYFIVLVRNPYAHAHGLLKRGMPDAAERVVRMLEYQKKNMETLDRVILVKYEETTDDPVETCARLVDWLPDLRGITTDFSFSYGGKQDPIVNMDAEKIASISKSDYENMSDVFRRHDSLIRFFDASWCVDQQSTRSTQAAPTVLTGS